MLSGGDYPSSCAATSRRRNATSSSGPIDVAKPAAWRCPPPFWARDRSSWERRRRDVAAGVVLRRLEDVHAALVVRAHVLDLDLRVGPLVDLGVGGGREVLPQLHEGIGHWSSCSGAKAGLAMHVAATKPVALGRDPEGVGDATFLARAVSSWWRCNISGPGRSVSCM